MKTCTGCEAEIATEATYCPHCGADPGRPKKLIAVTVLLCLGLAGAGGALYLQPALCSSVCTGPQAIAVSTQIAQDTASGVVSGVPYDNCGQIDILFSVDPRAAARARESETCLWQHYQEGQRAMLTVEVYITAPWETHLFTIHPADHAAPIHDEIAVGGNMLSAGTATCHVMDSTARGLQMEGCSGDAAVWMGVGVYGTRAAP